MEGSGTGREKLSLRRRLLAKKSPRVGCSMDADSTTSSSGDLQDARTLPEFLFVTKRSHENGDRACLSDSEAGPSFVTSTPQRLTNSSSAFIAPSSFENKPSIRPKSMIENHSHINEDRNSYPHYKQIDMLKYQQVIVKARSDPNCDMQLHNNDATKYGLSNMINAGILQNSRMSSSMSAMQQSTDDINISSQNRVNGLDKSSLDSIENSSSKASDREGIKDSRSCNTPRSGSTDSLARNSLLAAKVLRLIPTQKARERNYLHGRLASNSLLGAAELERVFPNREVEIYVGTWNMNGQMPPSELNDFLFPSNVKHVPDILAIGTQESTPERTEWEISIQEALGPSHLLFHSTTLGTLHLCIFLRRDLIWFCSLPEDSSISVRPGTAFRTKGAVAISFALFGTTFMFVTAHLTAHQEKVKERVHDIKRIIKSLDLPKNLPLKHKKNKDVTCNFDVVIWCGDLNFRLSENRAAVLRDLANTVRDGRFNSQNNSSPVSPSLLQADQLAAVLAGETILKGFQEAPIRFPPTYKYDPGTQIFDTSSKQRAPAYTDRILYKTRSNSSANSSSIPGLRRSSSVQSSEPISTVNCLAYDSVPTICSSDHKPVWALFTASLRPGTDIIPLAAGLFNREVYLEGIKRRAAMLDHPPGTSAVCSIQ